MVFFFRIAIFLLIHYVPYYALFQIAHYSRCLIHLKPWCPVSCQLSECRSLFWNHSLTIFVTYILQLKPEPSYPFYLPLKKPGGSLELGPSIPF